MFLLAKRGVFANIQLMKIVAGIKNKNVSVDAPPSKAHTLRAIIIASLAQGKSVIRKPLLGDDQLNVISCLKKLGVEISQTADEIIVNGTGGKYRPIADKLNVGESGVGMNFLTSAACLCERPVVITGSQRITERPVLEVVNGLCQLGCKIKYLEKEGFPPLKISGGGIKGGTAEIKGAKTSQYFSSIAISSPYAENKVTLKCTDTMTERPYLDISLGMMTAFGITAKNSNYKIIDIPNDKKYAAQQITVEGDYSSASFFFLAGAISRAKVLVRNLAPDTKQGDRKFLSLIEKMGCNVSVTDNGVIVQGTELVSIEQDMSDVPDLVPPMAIAAAFAKGKSRLTGIGHLRHKECDRLAVMASELGKMGICVQCEENALIIEGNEKIHGADIDPHNDHRIAMSFAVAGLVTGNQTIQNEGCVAKSFPDFWERFEIFSK